MLEVIPLFEHLEDGLETGWALRMPGLGFMVEHALVTDYACFLLHWKSDYIFIL